MPEVHLSKQIEGKITYYKKEKESFCGKFPLQFKIVLQDFQLKKAWQKPVIYNRNMRILLQ